MNEQNESCTKQAYADGFASGIEAERSRVVNLFMILHEAAEGRHNYWQVAAQLIQEG